MAGSIADLSPAEIECLRLVGEGVTASKAISARTRYSPGTVDTYLSRAARTLGAGSRREAASRYAELLAAGPTSQSGSQSSSARLAAAAAARFRSGAAGVRWLFSVPPISGPEHDLNWIGKTLAIARIAAVSLAVVALLAVAGAGLLWLAS